MKNHAKTLLSSGISIGWCLSGAITAAFTTNYAVALMLTVFAAICIHLAVYSYREIVKNVH